MSGSGTPDGCHHRTVAVRKTCQLPVLLAVVVLLALGACGDADPVAGPPPTPRYRIPSGTPTPAPAETPSASTVADVPDVQTAEDTPEARAAFGHGLDDYCRSFYIGQVHAEDSFPRPDLQSLVRFDRAAALSARSTERALADLAAPAALAQTYAAFVAITHDISTARADMATSLASTGDEGPAGDDFDTAIAARRQLASELGAPGCDGRLPPAQRNAAVAALEEFETTDDSAAACGHLSTPGFLQTRFFDLEDPLRGCIESRDHDTGGGLPTGIKVTDVTGSDGIAATIHYSLIGGCACLGYGETVARLHLVDGRWLVASFGS